MNRIGFVRDKRSLGSHTHGNGAFLNRWVCFLIDGNSVQLSAAMRRAIRLSGTLHAGSLLWLHLSMQIIVTSSARRSHRDVLMLY